MNVGIGVVGVERLEDDRRRDRDPCCVPCASCVLALGLVGSCRIFPAKSSELPSAFHVNFSFNLDLT